MGSSLYIALVSYLGIALRKSKVLGLTASLPNQPGMYNHKTYVTSCFIPLGMVFRELYNIHQKTVVEVCYQLQGHLESDSGSRYDTESFGRNSSGDFKKKSFWCLFLSPIRGTFHSMHSRFKTGSVLRNLRHSLSGQAN